MKRNDNGTVRHPTASSSTTHTTHTPHPSTFPAYANLYSPAPVRVLACFVYFCVFHVSGEGRFAGTQLSSAKKVTETESYLSTVLR